jgi:CRISPR-associated protein Cas2
MRIRYIVSYDISDPNRLRRVFRTMKGFGDPLQLSVFRCDLSSAERVLLIEAISKVINHREDQVMIIDIGPVDGRGQDRIETIGRAMDSSQLDRIAVIV